MRTQAEWNVLTHIFLATGPTSASTRWRISSAALLVKVMARMRNGLTPSLVDQVGDAMGEHPGLARAGPGHHQQRPVGRAPRRRAGRGSGHRPGRASCDPSYGRGVTAIRESGSSLVPTRSWSPGDRIRPRLTSSSSPAPRGRPGDRCGSAAARRGGRSTAPRSPTAPDWVSARRWRRRSCGSAVRTTRSASAARFTSSTTEWCCCCSASAMSPTVGGITPSWPRMARSSWCWAGVTPWARAASSENRRNTRSACRNRASARYSRSDSIVPRYWPEMPTARRAATGRD